MKILLLWHSQSNNMFMTKFIIIGMHRLSDSFYTIFNESLKQTWQKYNTNVVP